jgi:hypothetical protein
MSFLLVLAAGAPDGLQFVSRLFRLGHQFSTATAVSFTARSLRPG